MVVRRAGHRDGGSLAASIIRNEAAAGLMHMLSSPDEDFLNYCKQLGGHSIHHTEETRRLFNSLIERSKHSSSRVDQDDNTARPPERQIKHPDFQLEFDRPLGFAVLPRTFIPKQNNDVSIRSAALSNLATLFQDYPQWSEARKGKELEAMVTLIEILMKEMDEIIKTLVLEIVNANIINSAITHEGRQVRDLTMLFRYFKHSVPTPKLLEQVHGLIYNSVQETEVMNIVYKIHLILRVWPQQVVRGPGERLKCHITHRVKARRNDIVVNRYQRKKETESTHGLTLSNSMHWHGNKQKKKRKNDRGVFDIGFCVTGWGGERHQKFCQEQKTSVPDLPELEGAAGPAAKKVKAMHDGCELFFEPFLLSVTTFIFQQVKTAQPLPSAQMMEGGGEPLPLDVDFLDFNEVPECMMEDGEIGLDGLMGMPADAHLHEQAQRDDAQKPAARASVANCSAQQANPNHAPPSHTQAELQKTKQVVQMQNSEIKELKKQVQANKDKLGAEQAHLVAATANSIAKNKVCHQ